MTGKFELRTWLGILLIVISLLITLVADHFTFVESPRNHLETLLTWIPTLGYLLTNDRPTSFLFTLTISATGLGATGLLAINTLEKHLFEPLFFRKMVRAKLREEQLFNRYMNQSKS